ncbi:ATP-binding protein [Hymenobacter crusticola]|nr:AAA family ATPase [Hymenobacter crusticola]
MSKSKAISSVKTGNTIQSVYIEDLFGYYTYHLRVDSSNNLYIIYGDNGSGKTTILKLVFYILSTDSSKGYKTALANTKFKSIVVTLSNGIEVFAKRNESAKGGFLYGIRSNGNTYECNVGVEMEGGKPNGNIIVNRDEIINNKGYAALTQRIDELEMSVYFLKDNREVMASFKNQLRSRYKRNRAIFEQGLDYAIDGELLRRKANLEDAKSEIDRAFERFSDWIKSRVFRFSNIGEKNNKTIYMELIKSIADSNNNEDDSENKFDNKANILEQLKILSVRNKELSNFGLISDFDYESLATVLRGIASPSKLDIISKVLSPFIDGSNAKILALDEIYNVIISFINYVNEYFHDKEIRYSFHEGFWITHKNGENVPFNELSSGEKHLLLLWVNTITADTATIFIIDEPEISLNIKWQRRLLSSLLHFSSGRDIQFVVATHSVELLANNMDSVVRLVNEHV